MATFTVLTAPSFDFLSIDLFDLFNYSTELKLGTIYRFSNDAANFSNFTGAGFTYAGTTPDALTAGTITGFTRTVGGVTPYSFGGLSLSFTDFEAFRASGDTISFMGQILSGNDTIKGNVGNDVLFGISGNDRIDGGAGLDTMYGGSGNDTYVVDNVGDVVSELGVGIFEGSGSDTVESSITYSLGFNIENLTLTGTANINGFGNVESNIIKGNAGNNILDGGIDDDRMEGGAGNDTYFVDHNSDLVIDTAGVDIVFSSAQLHILGLGVENGTLIGSGFQLGGNALANTLDGNDFTNVIDGGNGNDVIRGFGSTDQLVGGEGLDTIDGGAGDDIIVGGNGNDVITGGLGDDLLDFAGGASGADQMTGGLGNDTYGVDNAGDLVIEAAAGGHDTVQSSIAYTLPSQVEELQLTGVLHISGTGNALANKLHGNSGNNTLNGLGGLDIMSGGAGNDIYVVDATGDLIVEGAAAGTDLVQASATYRLSFNVENLTLTGIGNINGTGNSQANTITGNTGNNILDGLIGADTMLGGLGNDTYFVDNAGDVTTDTGGTDLVKTTVTLTLGSGVENLELLGTATIGGFGNTLNNTITGNSASNALEGGIGADTLDGKGGADTLFGEAGADRFQFTVLAGGADQIFDFVHLTDDIVVSAATFGGGLVAGGAVVLTTGAAAVGAGIAQFVYNNVTGALSFDNNGATAGGSVTFANLTTLPVLTTADFIVIA